MMKVETTSAPTVIEGTAQQIGLTFYMQSSLPVIRSMKEQLPPEAFEEFLKSYFAGVVASIAETMGADTAKDWCAIVSSGIEEMAAEINAIFATASAGSTTLQ